MGRKPSTNLNLPKGMRARTRPRKHGQSVTYYYYDAGYVSGKRKEIPLGKDYISAVQQWAKLEAAATPKGQRATYSAMANRYLAEVSPTKSTGTQRNHRVFARSLERFFGNPDAPLDEITPQHIRQYLDWRRVHPGAANNETALLSAMWNKAREWGYTDKPNPCQGVKKFPTARRDVYIEDHVYRLVYQAADTQMRDMMDLAYITGQRPSDVVKIHSSHIFNGVLHITQQKTKAKLRFEVIGLLADIIERNTPAGGGYLFRNTNGSKMTRARLARRFSELRDKLAAAHPEMAEDLKQFQFRDLRAKSGTDAYLNSGSVEAAQKQLGHASPDMTKNYLRKDKTLKPLK